MSPYKAVIFDLDGTLADTIHDIAAAANASMAARQHPIHSLEEYRRMVGHGLRNLCWQALPQEARDEDELDICHRLTMQYYRAHPVDGTRLYPGMKQVLVRLHEEGLHLAVLSNKADELTRVIIEKLEVEPLFTVVSGLRDGFPRKPDPAGAHWVMDRLQEQAGERILPAEVLYVGDSGVDMQTAANCGFVSLGVTWGFRSREELIENGARHIADSAADILSTALS
ncbi:MAG: HAD family hydrolase [Bacteroidales bacterium]|nr:HAD family hydrolase [Bacteroidales bacterium]